MVKVASPFSDGRTIGSGTSRQVPSPSTASVALLPAPSVSQPSTGHVSDRTVRTVMEATDEVPAISNSVGVFSRSMSAQLSPATPISTAWGSPEPSWRAEPVPDVAPAESVFAVLAGDGEAPGAEGGAPRATNAAAASTARRTRRSVDAIGMGTGGYSLPAAGVQVIKRCGRHRRAERVSARVVPRSEPGHAQTDHSRRTPGWSGTALSAMTSNAACISQASRRDITGRTTPWRTNDRASRSAHVGLADTALPYRPDSCQAAEIVAGDVTVRARRPDSYLRAASLLLAGDCAELSSPVRKSTRQITSQEERSVYVSRKINKNN